MNNIFKNTSQFILMAIIVLLPMLGRASTHDLTVDKLVNQLQDTYEKTLNVSADFVQETIPAGSDEGIKARGRVFFARPSKMRWEYEEPEKQLIVTSGKNVYVYEKEAGQVMVIPREKFLSSEISQAFFFGKGKLKKYFKVSLPTEKWLKNKAQLKLTPIKDNMQIKTMWIGLDPNSGLIKQIWMEDRLGTRTHIIFSNISINSDLSPNLFHFQCPPNVEVYQSQDLELGN